VQRLYRQSDGPVRCASVGWLLTYGLPDMVVAFPMKNSIGTWNLVTQAKARKIPIRIVRNHL